MLSKCQQSIIFMKTLKKGIFFLCFVILLIFNVGKSKLTNMPGTLSNFNCKWLHHSHLE